MNSFPPVTPTTTNPQDSIPPHFLPPDCTLEVWHRSVLAMWTRARRYDWSIPDTVLDRMRDVLLGRVSLEPMLEPIKMVLYCPACGEQHVDASEFPVESAVLVRDSSQFMGVRLDHPNGAPVWTNPPHRSHLCLNPECRHVWRPADVPTEGVREIATRGQCDDPRPTRAPL